MFKVYTYSTSFPGFSIADFEQANISWFICCRIISNINKRFPIHVLALLSPALTYANVPILYLL